MSMLGENCILKIIVILLIIIKVNLGQFMSYLKMFFKRIAIVKCVDFKAKIWYNVFNTI